MSIFGIPGQIWSPTSFGSVTARAHAFSVVHSMPSPLSLGEVDASLDCAIRTIAHSALIAASAGDLALLGDCGFAVEHATSKTMLEGLELKEIHSLCNKLTVIASDSKLRQYWIERKGADEFTNNVEHIIQQLHRFPKCRQSKFPRFAKKAVLQHAVAAGENFFDGPTNTLSITHMEPLDIITIGKFRGVERIKFLPLTNYADAHSFDWLVRFSVQNWAGSIKEMCFSRIGTLSGSTRFEFPDGITRDLKMVNLVTFEASGFVADDEIIASIIGKDLWTISLGFNRLTPRVFDLLENECENLKRFNINPSFECSDEFFQRAMTYQSNHRETKVHINGWDLKKLNANGAS
ncbi:MAG: hypothetical protein KDB00_19085 [Planctomycetales bacterium]|nr:hypothetical protein [Planctomycetales bacterium]